MFKTLTDQELVNLFNMLKRCRDRIWYWNQSAGYGVVLDCSALMNDIHHENKSR